MVKTDCERYNCPRFIKGVFGIGCCMTRMRQKLRSGGGGNGRVEWLAGSNAKSCDVHSLAPFLKTMVPFDIF